MRIKRLLVFALIFAFLGLLLACDELTSQPPTTQTSTTQLSTTKLTTTQSPTTTPPTTQSPTTTPPTTQLPTTTLPTTQPSSTMPTTTQPPTTMPTTTQPPTTMPTTTQPPTTMPTTTQPPTTMPTTTQPTTTQPLTTQPTTTLPPTTQAPTTLNPADYPQLFNPSNPDVYVFEIEGQITGTPSYGEVFIENIEAASGGQTVGYFATLGNKITWNINATENVTVAIDLVMSSSLMRQTDYVVINQPINPSTFGVKVNGVAIRYPEYT